MSARLTAAKPTRARRHPSTSPIRPKVARSASPSTPPARRAPASPAMARSTRSTADARASATPAPPPRCREPSPAPTDSTPAPSASATRGSAARDPALPRQEGLPRGSAGPRRHHPPRPEGRVHLAHGSFGRRQKHALAAPLLRRAAHQREDPDRRKEPRPAEPVRRSVPAQEPRDRLPGLQAARQPDRAGQRRLRAGGAGRLRRGDPRAGPEAAGASGPLAQGWEPAPAALRRRAAARRHRPGAGQRADHPARGRAHRKPRSLADRQHPPAPLRRERARHHGGRGHPRPDAAAEVAPPNGGAGARESGVRRMIAHVVWRLSRRAAVNLWRARLPSLVSVFTIGLALFIGASFVLGLFTARTLLTSWGAQDNITLYLDPQTTESQALALSQQIQARGDLEVQYVDPAAALRRLRSDLGELAGALDGLTRNPLPPSLEVKPRVPLAVPAVRVLAAELGQLGGVRDVEYGREWLDKLEALGRGLRAFGAGALLAVIGAALLVVANTIRLAVYARRDEIEVMKLVGATDRYVRAPFLMEGAVQGLCGAALAVSGLLAVQRLLLPRAAAAFAFASGAQAPHLSAQHCALLAAAGALVGLGGSYLAVARFLRA